jgi:hypothetical protein
MMRTFMRTTYPGPNLIFGGGEVLRHSYSRYILIIRIAARRIKKRYLLAALPHKQRYEPILKSKLSLERQSFNG